MGAEMEEVKGPLRSGEPGTPGIFAAERSELLQRDGVTGAASPSAVPLSRGRSLERSMSQSLVPGASRSLLQLRSDHQVMLEFQEGMGGIAEHSEAEGLGTSAPAVPSSRREQDGTIWGMDKRPFFPAVLFGSLLWSMYMTRLQGMVMTQMFGSAQRCRTFFLAMYLVTISSAAYTAMSNPGLMPEELYRRWQAGHLSLPQRAHKHWLYRRPILRFHQYCRWVTNCIGLRNHRAYMIMLAGFVTIGVVDALLDLVLVTAHFRESTWSEEILLLLHFAYSLYFSWYATPLLRQHSAFILRNELTQEWKRDAYYVVRSDVTGEVAPVTELDPEEYNNKFDEFIYEPSRNPFDKGPIQNCLNFWLTDRSDPDELGEF